MAKEQVNGGTKTVTSSGTAEALSTSQPCSAVLIQALEANTGLIYAGGSNVSSSTKNGIMKRAEGTLTIPCENLSDVYIAVSVSGEGVSYIWIP